MRVFIVTLSLLGQPAFAQTTEQFDLVCVGETKSASEEQKKSWSARYSVDLKSEKWCGPDCKAPAAIASVEPDKLRLKNDGPHNVRFMARGEKHTISIQRADGRYEEILALQSVGVFSVTEGACTVAEFTTLPTTLF